MSDTSNGFRAFFGVIAVLFTVVSLFSDISDFLDDDDDYSSTYDFSTEEQTAQLMEQINHITYCRQYKNLTFNGTVVAIHQQESSNQDAVKIALTSPFPTLLDSVFLLVEQDTISFDYTKNVFHVGDAVVKEQGQKNFTLLQEEQNIEIDLMEIEGKDYCKRVRL